MAGNIGDFLKKLVDTNYQPQHKVYSKKILSNASKQKLLAYQESHVVRIINTLLTHYVALDASDTGVGKTYIAAAVCKELDRKPIIICPKTLIFNWITVLELFQVEHYDIVNYETIKNGKTYCNDNYKTRKSSPFVSIVDPAPGAQVKIIHDWDVPKDAIIIFDEAHRCKDPSTDNGKLILSTKRLISNKIPVLLLSATICEKVVDMKIPFYLFGFIPNMRAYKAHITNVKAKYPNLRARRNGTKADRVVEEENLQSMILYEEIKEYTSRIRIKDLGDKFPSNQWCAQQFFAEEADKIAEAYAEIAELMKKLKEEPGKGHLGEIVKLKQEIEFKKVPIFIEQAQLYLDEGKSVIIFVNYLKSLAIISDELAIRCKIYGDQTMEERQEAIELFQSNQERIIICQIRAGGVGISLHDLHGGHPRVTLINYPDSASNLLQALGRAPRSGAKTPVLQRIIFVANVEYEKKIMQNINRKLTNISAINDGDLDGYKYKINKITRKRIPKKKPARRILPDDDE